MSKGVFVGFGFGPIQAGLFLAEAYRSGNFERLVVAEVVPEVVEAVRRAGGCYRVNVATRNSLEIHEIKGVEIYNPLVADHREALIASVASATELATALPSVDFYDKGDASVAEILARGLQQKLHFQELPPCVIYAGENHNRAAEILEETVRSKLTAEEARDLPRKFQALNTVIGKMSGVVRDSAEIKNRRLATMTEGADRAFLVEEFNRILISRISLHGFRRGIEVFEEKADLLPFKEAKLYGHNAVHALLGYLAHRMDLTFMSDAARHSQLMKLARDAFLEESGKALLARHAGLDALFTPDGYERYADDLLERMVNPYLRDRVERVTRDPRRKLGWDDRLIGTMRLALDAGVTPRRFAMGAAAALDLLAAEQPGRTRDQLLAELWPVPDEPPGRKDTLAKLILNATEQLANGIS